MLATSKRKKITKKDEKKNEKYNQDEMELELLANYKGSFKTIDVLHQLVTSSSFND
jgi:hypothetical protein